MKIIDRVIDYVADRVLDRAEARKPRMVVNNSVNVKSVDELERQLKDRRTLDSMRYRGRPSA